MKKLKENAMEREWENNIIENRSVIDFHTHPYLREEENMGVYLEDFYLPTEEVREDVGKAGISLICGSVLNTFKRGPVSSFDEIRTLNRDALKLKKIYGDFYLPGFHVHPGYLQDSLEEVAFMHKAGVKLVGELVPYLHGWAASGHDYSSEALREILHLAGEYGMVVSFHTMPEWPKETEAMVRNNPDVTFVAAHPGQREDFLLHVERMEKYPNLYLDLSGTGLFRYGLLASAVKKVGSQRLLFGTDYPICNPRMYVQAVLGEHISQQDKENILFRNAGRILGLEH